MVKDHLMEPFELVLREPLEVCPRGIHTHTFFELVYIRTGSGKQLINHSELAYATGDLFILAPNDTHIFNIAEPTQFFFVRFNPHYIRSGVEKNSLQERLDEMLSHVGQIPGPAILTARDMASAGSILEMLIAEHLENGLYHKELTIQLVNSLLTLIARNLARSYPQKIGEKSDDKAIAILEYIQTHIHTPEMLKIPVISDHFHITENYLGRYFKKQTAESLQEYIQKYRIRLIENRLLHSNMRISEIADEFGFADKSHLNRIFKKYNGINPSDFRKQSVRF